MVLLFQIPTLVVLVVACSVFVFQILVLVVLVVAYSVFVDSYIRLRTIDHRHDKDIMAFLEYRLRQ